jgi:O-antigen/teichoic acid export membrane protein
MQRPNLRHLSGYIAVLGVQTIVGIVQMVVLIATVGPRSWADLSVGQAVGLVGATVVTCGLGSFGASLVASTPEAERASFYWSTVRPRLILITSIGPLVAVSASLLASEVWLAAAMVSTSALLSGVGASWYFVGQARPRQWLLLEIAPTSAGILAGCVAAAITHSATHFAAFQLMGVVVGVATANRAVRRDFRWDNRASAPHTLVSFVRSHSRLLIAAASGSANTQAPLIVLAAFGSPLLPQFALLDRLTKYVLAGFSPFLQVAQSWIPGDVHFVRQRATTALRWAGLVAVAAALAFAALATWAAQLLSSGLVLVPSALVVPFAVLLGVLIVAQVCALAVLVPLGLSRVLAWTTAVGSVVLAAVTALAAAVAGASAVAWTVAVVEGVILSWQVGAVIRTGKSR